MTDHNRIVTPYTDPERWTEEEKAVFDAGQCSWQTAYGLPWMEDCGQPSKSGASFGYCAEHERELLEEYYADGSPRFRTAEEYAANKEAER